jgi:ribonuclease BN (tRNA processing enzyme)
MRVKVLGAHNTESAETRYVCLLIDDVLALDAGCLTSSLSFEQQTRVKDLLLTHGHYDHLRDIPALAMNLYLRRCSLNLYTHQEAWNNLTAHLLNGSLYSEFHKKPADRPTVNFHPVTAGEQFAVNGYKVLPVPVKHSISTFGYQVTDSEGKSLFYSGDTGYQLSAVWQKIMPRVLVIELTAINAWTEHMRHNGHLTPELLKAELLAFKQIRGYLPRIITIHMNPADSAVLSSEIRALSSELDVQIEPAYEGMLIDI